jgi:hypothetical protein
MVRITIRISLLRNAAGMALTVSHGHARHLVVTDEAIITVERRSEEERRQASIAALVVGGGVMGAPWAYRKVRAHLARAGYVLSG